MDRPAHHKADVKQCLHLCADAAMGDIQRRIVERVPSIGRGQILSAEDAPARIDAGIELELGPASDDRVPMRTWPEQVDPVHGRAGVSTSGPGETFASSLMTSEHVLHAVLVPSVFKYLLHVLCESSKM